MPLLNLYFPPFQRVSKNTFASTARWKSVWSCGIQLQKGRGEGLAVPTVASYQRALQPALGRNSTRAPRFLFTIANLFIHLLRSSPPGIHQTNVPSMSVWLQGFWVCHVCWSSWRGQSFGPNQTRVGLKNSEFHFLLTLTPEMKFYYFHLVLCSMPG